MSDQRSIVALIFGWRRLIYRITAIAVLVAVVGSLLMSNWYAATATCMPPEESERPGALVSMFSRFGLEFGAGGLVSSTPMSDLMLGVLKSRRLRGAVVDRFDLVEVYEAESRRHAVADLADHLQVGMTADGLIEVQVEDKDRERAAAMANTFVELLDQYNRETSIERAGRTREFIDVVLQENRARLEQAARELEVFRREHGAIELTEQTRVTVEAIAELESERTALEIERGLLEGFSAPESARMRQITARIRELNERISELKEGTDGDDGPGVFIPLSEIPSLGLRLADLTREVMVQETVREYLTSQYEEARIQEARDLRSIRVVDEAVPPIKKHRPRRSIIVILTLLVALAGSVGLAFAADSLESYLASEGAEAVPMGSRESRIIRRAVAALRTWGGPRDGAATEPRNS